MPEPIIRPDDYKVARAQYIKSKRTEVRLRYALMADAEVARSVPEWQMEFDIQFRETAPQVLDLHSELRRLGAGMPAPKPASDFEARVCDASQNIHRRDCPRDCW